MKSKDVEMPVVKHRQVQGLRAHVESKVGGGGGVCSNKEGLQDDEEKLEVWIYKYIHKNHTYPQKIIYTHKKHICTQK